MAFVSDMIDQLRDLLNDVADAQVSFATKKLYLNRGIFRLWPDVYRIQSTSVTIVAGTYDYALPVAAADGMIVSVEISTAAAGVEYRRLDQYDILSGDEDVAGVFRLGLNATSFAGYVVRIGYAAPVPAIVAVSYVAAQSEVWVGPDRAIGLPVLYAMGMVSARKLDDRQDATRYSTTQALNGVTDEGIISSSQMWFGQFEVELADMARPLPIARD